MTQSRHCGPRSQLPYFVKSWEDANLGAAQGASSHGITSSYQEFQMIHGHCECGLVSFEADCKISDFSHCHCSQCRRLHGAAYATFAEVESREFRYVSGEEIIKVYASSEDSDRVFCGNCGSNILVYTKSYPDFLYLSMGAIDGNPDHPTAYHQYVGSKAPWHEITDDAAQFDGDPPE